MNEVVIIAEAGVNHNGNIELAKKLIDAAADAGADYVKFQTFKADKIASRSAVKADYQKESTVAEETQLEMLRKLELSFDDHVTLLAHCKSRSIQFLSTPFDLESITLLQQLGVRVGKIPSGEITNLIYLQRMAKCFEELILSTGMADMNEIRAALEVLQAAGFPKDKLTILHCTTEYPTPFEEVNLKAMESIEQSFGVRVGYSDHTLGIQVPIAAVALGACLIEKHFTLNRNMDGPDHKASLEPEELKAMIQSIRIVEQALGDGIKRPTVSEAKNKAVARKSLVATRDLPEGHVLVAEDLTAKRPGTGISPMLLQDIVGKQLKKLLSEDEIVTFEHLTT